MSQLYYHYTDASTALKILTNKELWLTHTGYLNDANEGLDILPHLHKYIKDKNIIKLLEFVDSRVEAYTCSFSTEKDLLSQWRGYCPPEEGYAIGFKSPEKFQSLWCKDGISIEGAPKNHNSFCLTSHTQRFEACIYDDEVKDEIIKSLALSMKEKYIQLKIDIPAALSSPDGTLVESKDLLQRLSADEVWLIDYVVYKFLFKDKAFKEEKEYRFIVTFDSDYSQDPCYRTKDGAFIPYYRYCFSDEDVKKVVIRKTKNTDKCEQGLKHFLINHKNMSSDEADNFIDTSNIPFQ